MSRCNHTTYDSCLHGDECAQCLREKAEAHSLHRPCYPLRSLEEFASWLIAHGIIDECSYWDADGYDGGRTLERLSRALQAAKDNDEAHRRAEMARQKQH